MSRSGDERAGGRAFRRRAPGPSAALAALLLGATILIAPPARAQSGVQETGVELSPTVRLSLQKLQEQWLQWVAAFYRDDREAASVAEREMSRGGLPARHGTPAGPRRGDGRAGGRVGGGGQARARRLGARRGRDAGSGPRRRSPSPPRAPPGPPRATWTRSPGTCGGSRACRAGQPERAVLGRSVALWLAAGAADRGRPVRDRADRGQGADAAIATCSPSAAGRCRPE